MLYLGVDDNSNELRKLERHIYQKQLIELPSQMYMNYYYNKELLNKDMIKLVEEVNDSVKL